MKILTEEDLKQDMSNTEIIDMLVREHRIGRNEADFYLALLGGVKPGDVATSSDQEIEDFMRLREVAAESEPDLAAVANPAASRKRPKKPYLQSKPVTK